MADRSKFEEIMAQLDEDGGSTPDTPANTESGSDDEFSRIMAQARGDVVETAEAERQTETAPVQTPAPGTPAQLQTPAQPRVLRPLVDDGTLLPTRGNQPMLTRRRLIFGVLGAAGLGALGFGVYQCAPDSLSFSDDPEKLSGSKVMEEYVRIAHANPREIQRPGEKRKRPEPKKPDKKKDDQDKDEEKDAGKSDAPSQEDYSKRRPRQMHVLKQIAANNVPESFHEFEEIVVKGKKGTILKFWASKRGLCVGSRDCVEIALDAPHSMAAAELLGYQLPTYWMVDRIYEKIRDAGEKLASEACKEKKDQKDKKACAKQAMAKAGKVKFYVRDEIGKALEIPNWASFNQNQQSMWQDSPEFIAKRNELLKEWMDEHDVEEEQLIGGYFKSVIHPVPEEEPGPLEKLVGRLTGRGYSRIGNLAIYGGYDDQGEAIQGVGQVHAKVFFDYSQGLRLVYPMVFIQRPGEKGQLMSMNDVFRDMKLQSEFGYNIQPVQDRAYPYYNELTTFVEANKKKAVFVPQLEEDKKKEEVEDKKKKGKKG